METAFKAFAAIGFFVVMAFGVSALLALLVQPLWNSTMPDVFGVGVITYWQAVKLTMLCTLLFESTSTSSSIK